MLFIQDIFTKIQILKFPIAVKQEAEIFLIPFLKIPPDCMVR